MKRHHLLGTGLGLLLTFAAVGLPVRAADEPIDYDSLNKIKNQGLVAANSQVMDVASWLTDVHGPRLSGSPGIQKAGTWAVAKMKEWGLENVRMEPWPADASGGNNGFPRGWTNEKFYLAAVSPQAFPIPGAPSVDARHTVWSGEVVLTETPKGAQSEVRGGNFAASGSSLRRRPTCRPTGARRKPPPRQARAHGHPICRRRSRRSRRPQVVAEVQCPGRRTWTSTRRCGSVPATRLSDRGVPGRSRPHHAVMASTRLAEVRVPLTRPRCCRRSRFPPSSTDGWPA